MDFAAFKATIAGQGPPAGLGAPLQALWWAAKGDWDKAHTIVMNDESVEAAWVHAYLHRKEGDRDNAAYWYRRAGKPVCREPLDAEWRGIAEDLLRNV